MTRRQRVVIHVKAGPTWQSGPPGAQSGWEEHARFIDELVAAGTMVMGGPFSDHSGAIMLLEGVDAAEARAIAQRDPFVQNGVFVIEDVRDWTVYVDTARPPRLRLSRSRRVQHASDRARPRLGHLPARTELFSACSGG